MHTHDNEMRQMLEMERIKSVKAQAKMQEQDFNNAKQVTQLELKVASLMRLKSSSSINSPEHGARYSVDSESKKYAAHDDSQFELLDQLDAKI